MRKGKAWAVITLCTLFDSAYMAKGLSLIASLRRHSPDSVLYVLCLDSQVSDYFDGVTITRVIPIRLAEVESPEVLAAKANRTRVEYYWTLASVFTLWCVEHFNLSSIAYIDADCYLFGSLDTLYNEIDECPVAITPHRYTPSQYERLKAAGVYNVGLVYFSSCMKGYDCLRYWRTQCLSWCYHRIMADGRMGDQGYLNDWPKQWKAHSIYNLGVNLAPWNQEQYEYWLDDGQLIVANEHRGDPLTLYHFHGFAGIGNRTGYKLHPMVAKHVYEPYEAEYAKWQLG